MLIPFKAAVNFLNSERLHAKVVAVDVSVTYLPRNLVPTFEICVISPLTSETKFLVLILPFQRLGIAFIRSNHTHQGLPVLVIVG